MYNYELSKLYAEARLDGARNIDIEIKKLESISNYGDFF